MGISDGLPPPLVGKRLADEVDDDQVKDDVSEDEVGEATFGADAAEVALVSRVDLQAYETLARSAKIQ